MPRHSPRSSRRPRWPRGTSGWPVTPTRYTGAGTQPTVAKACPARTASRDGDVGCLSLSVPAERSPRPSFRQEPYCPERADYRQPVPRHAALSGAKIAPGVSPKTGLSRAHPGWKTGPQLLPSCQTKGRKRFAGKVGQGFELHRLAAVLGQKRGGGAAPREEKSSKRNSPGVSDPPNTAGSPGRGRRVLNTSQPPPLRGQRGAAANTLGTETPAAVSPSPPPAKWDPPPPPKAPQPSARYLQGRPLADHGTCSWGPGSRGAAHGPAPDLLYCSLPRWDGAEGRNLCHGEGMPRRASHGTCPGAMPGSNGSVRRSCQGQAKPLFFPTSLGFASQSSSIPVANQSPLRPGR